MDGLPSQVLPPAETIARLTVNADPFSAEYSDGDRNQIAITTKYPDRRFRPSFGGDFLGAGGGSVLASGLHSKSRSVALGLSGPIPLSPLTFSLHARLGSSQRDEPILAVTEKTPSGFPAAAATSSESSTFFLETYYSAFERLRANVSFQQSKLSSSNTNVGGLILPEAAFGTMSTSRQIRGSLEIEGPHLVYQGGMVLSRTKAERTAGQAGRLGVGVLGSFVGGGARLEQSRGSRRDWTVKSVVRSKGARFWSAGVTVSGSAADELEVPNPAGFLQFESLPDYAEGLEGAQSGTWFIDRGEEQVRYDGTVAAAFVQSDLLHRRHLLVRGGLRVDRQTGDTTLFSPRFFAASQLRGFTLRGGGGVFINNWPDELFTEVMKGGGEQPRRYLVEDVSFGDLHEATLARGRPISSELARELARARDWMLSLSVERRSGAFVPGLEYRWTRGQQLLGSRRLFTGAGWSDRVESNRTSKKHQLHARLRWRWKGQTVVGHYEWVHSYDNTDGPFSFPERQDDIAAEWARTSGVSPHNVSIVGSFQLPGRGSLSLVWTSRSSSPYNVTSSRDIGRNGLYNDRGGRPRNTGKGPGFNSLSLFAHQRIRLPGFLSPKNAKLHADLGIRADNLLGNRNYLGFGSVIGSPLFGRPWGALPGRSLRVWLNFRR